jgi:hypothetical protein
MTNSSLTTRFIDRISSIGFDGLGPLGGSRDLAAQYLHDRSLRTTNKKIAALIRWETSKSFSSGMVTGIGGLAMMPFTLPADLAATWVIQTRMVGAIAVVLGHDIDSELVRTVAVLCLLGDAAKEAVKEVGLELLARGLYATVASVPERVLSDINNRVGFHLLSHVGGMGSVQLGRIVPVVGGIVAGTIDAVACHHVGNIAKKVFEEA